MVPRSPTFALRVLGEQFTPPPFPGGPHWALEEILLANGMDKKKLPSAKRDKKEKREATKTEERARRVNNMRSGAVMAEGLQP